MGGILTISFIVEARVEEEGREEEREEEKGFTMKSDKPTHKGGEQKAGDLFEVVSLFSVFICFRYFIFKF